MLGADQLDPLPELQATNKSYDANIQPPGSKSIDHKVHSRLPHVHATRGASICIRRIAIKRVRMPWTVTVVAVEIN